MGQAIADQAWLCTSPGSGRVRATSPHEISDRAVERAELRIVGFRDVGPELLVQRYSPGPRHSVYFAARNGCVLARLEVVSERTDRIDGTGFAVEGISVPADPTLLTYADSLLAQSDYSGIGCLQFLRRSDGSFHFLELNPRLGGNSAIAVHCGLDLPWLACELAQNRLDGPPSSAGMRLGQRYAWTFGEVQGIRRARARGGNTT